MALMFEVTGGEPIVAADPDDDIFLRCASVAGARYVVSGDRHLLDLGEYDRISILSVNEFLDHAFSELSP
jgi:predicted nucleic acid-binding protein